MSAFKFIVLFKSKFPNLFYCPPIFPESIHWAQVHSFLDSRWSNLRGSTVLKIELLSTSSGFFTGYNLTSSFGKAHSSYDRKSSFPTHVPFSPSASLCVKLVTLTFLFCTHERVAARAHHMNNKVLKLGPHLRQRTLMIIVNMINHHLLLHFCLAQTFM